jgi:uncharacterized protein YbjT (DUF2867 family)
MKVAVTGGTGLIGNEILKALSADDKIDEIISIARREGSAIPKVKWIQADLDSKYDLKSAVSGCEAALCALGTTMKKAGSKDAFKKVDLDYVVNFARASKEAGIDVFGVVSAIGSDPSSSVFYNKVKGMMESELKSIGFQHLVLAQPSILLGNRTENRLGERIGIAVMSALAPIMIGSLKKYRPIKSHSVARALAHETLNASKGIQVLTYEELSRF